MIEKHTIKSDRQGNGLWGTPLYLRHIEGNMMFKDIHTNELFSAILMSFAECKRENFSLDIKNDGRFMLQTDKSFYYKIEDFGLIGNTLYFLPNDEDKKIFSRTIKLKKLSTK